MNIQFKFHLLKHVFPVGLRKNGVLACSCSELPGRVLLALTRRLAADAERMRGAPMVHDLATALGEHLRDGSLGMDVPPLLQASTDGSESGRFDSQLMVYAGVI